MSLNNYRDLSTADTAFNAGFQFEFYCDRCNETWRSPFTPYRSGQIAGLLSRFTYLLFDHRGAGRASRGLAEFGSGGAKTNAFDEALVTARQRFHACSHCDRGVCSSCWDAQAQMCRTCATERQSAQQRDSSQVQPSVHAPPRDACPNCGTSTQGGRFCPECGFDMASTHKSCPGCGALVLRASRFCTDCGHGF
jgi:ribosomal protein L32